MSHFDKAMELFDINDPHCINWFPGYGCVVLFHHANDQWSGEISIDVIGLDKHEHEMHFGKNQYQSTSLAESYTTLHVGTIAVDEKVMFDTKFRQKFDEKRARKGDERSAAGGKQGHQKTPAFIHAVLIEALTCECNEDCACNVLPIGGLTDVGLHTGGLEGDTCYALVRSIFEWIFWQALSLDGWSSSFSNEDVSFDLVMVHFHLNILEKAMSEVDEINADIHNGILKPHIDTRVSFLFEMIRYVVVCITNLPQTYDVSSYKEKLKTFRKQLDDSISHWNKATTKANEIIFEQLNDVETPEIFVPEYQPPLQSESISTEDINRLIMENIGVISIIKNSKDFKTIAAWAHKWKAEYSKSETKIFIFLRQIEQVFWDMSERGIECQCLSDEDLDALMDLIDDYREVLEAYSRESKYLSRSILLNRMRCVELLMVWLGYCIVFNTCSLSHPDEMTDFGVALHYQDLQVLLLQDKIHLTQVKKVANFLQSRHKPGNDLFSTREEQNWSSPTFEFAARYARRNFHSIWLEEKNDADQRVEKHWNEVVRKQNLARQLRSELRSLEDDLEMEWCKTNYDRSESKINRLEQKIRSKKNEIEIAEKAPSPILQPLPCDKDRALKIIFFLFIPKKFKHLCRLTFIAQQLLVPRPWVCDCGGADGVEKVNILDTISVVKKCHDWISHYDNSQRSVYHTPSKTRKGAILDVKLSMHFAVPQAKEIGPKHVDHFYNKNEGIWYPDDNNTRFIWYGEKYYKPGEAFNPFRIRSSYTGE